MKHSYFAGSGVLRPGRLVAMLSMTLLLPFSARSEGRDAAQRNRDANQAFRANNFEQATDLYDDALTLEPESGVISYNLGNALYRQGQFEEASTALLRGMLADDPAVRQNALYNAGNAFVQLQKYPEALTAYRKALELDPYDRDAKVNFEKAMRLLQQQQQQQQQQQEKGDEKGENEEKQDPESGDQEQQENQDQQGDSQQDENEQNQEQQQQQESEGEQEKEEQQEQEPQEAQADSMRAVGEMTPEEAMRILDAMREQEKELQKEKARKAQAMVRGVEKDW
jgi:tetratricopeptide (TPR) repeat protein